MKRFSILVLAFAMVMAFSAIAFAEGLPQETVTERTSWEKNRVANETNAPKVKEMPNGVLVQKTPQTARALDTQAGDVESKTIASWNNIFLNADNRGCTACHTIEDALEMMETYHGIIYMGYETEQGLQNCFGCHSFYDSKLRDSIHALHNFSSTFKAMNGTCESCHYIDVDAEGKVAYKRWDYVKYDILQGYIPVAAENAAASFEWNQTEVTPHEKMYFKSVKTNPLEWLVSDSQASQDLFDKWTISFTGSIGNPVDMTLPELIEKYGTEDRLMKNHCTVNGPGMGMIYQAKITGIPLRLVVEDLAVDPATTMVNPIGDDGYCYTISLEAMLKEDALLVVAMNDEMIYADQGFPVAFWCNEMSAGNFTKRICELNFSTEGASWDFYGDFTDATTGLQFDKPNVGVLNAYDGQIFEGAVHLEGYADAWNEPITKIEFSLDKGATWIEQEIADANTTQWVYWKLDLNGLTPGSYLMKIRVSSLMADGTIRTNEVPNQMTNYTFVVR
ncbi:MAG: molybdopterin-dependent oxidoreductase [Clostridia bacterium]|nr:molybdopterin-dependent oxidoreductase [Clostridia bacterium]